MSYKTKRVTTLNYNHLHIANKINRIIKEENENLDKNLILDSIRITGDDKDCNNINKVEFEVFQNIHIKGKKETHTIGCDNYHYSYDCEDIKTYLTDIYKLNDFNLVKENKEIWDCVIEELQKDI